MMMMMMSTRGFGVGPMFRVAVAWVANHFPDSRTSLQGFHDSIPESSKCVNTNPKKKCQNISRQHIEHVDRTSPIKESYIEHVDIKRHIV
jgi:hypothetical protein